MGYVEFGLFQEPIYYADGEEYEWDNGWRNRKTGASIESDYRWKKTKEKIKQLVERHVDGVN